MANRGLGPVAGAREILRQMPKDRPFLASELPLTIQGDSWGNLVARELIEKAGRVGPDRGRRWMWQMTKRAKRLVEEKE